MIWPHDFALLVTCKADPTREQKAIPMSSLNALKRIIKKKEKKTREKAHPRPPEVE